MASLALAPVKVHDGDSLAAMLADLSKQCHAPIDIHAEKLAEFKINVAAPVRLKWIPSEPMPLQSALDLIARSIEGNQVRFDIEPGRVTCSTAQDLGAEYRKAREVYPVGDLLAARTPYDTWLDIDGRREQLRNLFNCVANRDDRAFLGDSLAFCEFAGDDLVVNATPSAHYLIGQMLEELRRK